MMSRSRKNEKKVYDVSTNVKGTITGGIEGKCDIDMPDPFCLVIFGASGDLTKRKIIPSIYRLERLNLLPRKFFIFGSARSELTDDEFRVAMRDAVQTALPDDFSASAWKAFASRLYYLPVSYTDVSAFKRLSRRIQPIEKKHKTNGNRIMYMATPPTVLESIIQNIGDSGLSLTTTGYTHVVIEKPFGRDYDSARKLNSLLRTLFEEKQIYRMDHYLAKENVQNILMFRFANSIFEPLWNRRYIDHVQITVSETLGVEHRAGYYETAGILRDMFQNHLLQLFALIAMEPPSVFEADRVRDEKVKVFRSMRPFPLNSLDEFVVAGQYGKGKINKKNVAAYRDEPGVAPKSVIPTFAAMKVYIDNWRWNSVPFYLRSGKRLASRKAEISIHFRPVPHIMFSQAMEEEIEPNTLILRVQPDEGIRLNFQTKNPGSKICLNPVVMDFTYPKVFMLDAYERVLLDCMQGDQMLFVRADGMERTWSLLTPLIEKLDAVTKTDMLPNYASGSSGPPEADALIERDGRRWRPL
jgi:glucose-6-phosphate 1-dehydrogenase